MSNDVEIKFGADIAELKTKLAELASEVSSSTKSASDAAKSNFTAIEASISSLKVAIAPLLVLLAPLVAAFGAKQLIETASAFELLEVRLKAVMGSAEQGQAAFAWIKQFAVDTPYSVKQVTDAFMQLKNFGLDPMDGTLQKVSDASAKYGKSADTAQRVTLALGQAWARGKLQGQDTLQMIDAGIPVYDLLSKALGKTTAEIQKMSEKGEMGRDVMQKLIDQMGVEGAGAAADKMKTYAGAVSNMGDAFDNAIDKLRKGGGFDFITQSILEFTKAIPAVVETFGAMCEAVGVLAKELYGVLKSVFGMIFGIIDGTFGSNGSAVTMVEFFKIVYMAVVSFRVGLENSFVYIKYMLASLVAVFVGAGETISNFFKAVAAGASGDFSGAAGYLSKSKNAWKEGLSEANAIITEGHREMQTNAKKGIEDINKILSGKQDERVPDTKRKAAEKTAAAGTQKAASEMPVLDEELRLAQIAILTTEYREMTKKEERAFWAEKLAGEHKNAADTIAIRKKIETITISSIRESMKEIAALKDADIEREKQSALSLIALEEQTIRAAVAAGSMSKIQGLEYVASFEKHRYEIEVAAVQARLMNLEKDPNSSPVAKQKVVDELLTLDRKYAHEQAKIEADAVIAVAEESKKANADMQKFAEHAAKNMQDALANFLFDPFKGGLKGMLDGFSQMLRQMAAQAAAAAIMKNIFSGMSGMGGFLGELGGMMGGGREGGGYTSAGVVYQVGEGNKPEIFKSGGKQYMISGDNGAVISNKDLGGKGDTSTTQNMNITVNSTTGNPDEIRRAVGQAAREAMGAMGMAQRYA